MDQKPPVERIVVRKIFPGSAAMFGLLFGLLLGILTALVLVILEFSGVSVYTGAGIDGYLFALIAGAVYFVAFFVMMIVVALLYNLSARLGGRLDLGLAEYRKHEKKAKRGKANHEMRPGY